MLKELYQPNPEFSKNARIKSMDEYYALVKKSTDDYEGFWADYANEKIDWIEPFTNVLSLFKDFDLSHSMIITMGK